MVPVLPLLVAAAVLPPSAALAAEAHVESDAGRVVLVYTAGSGETNSPSIRRRAGMQEDEISIEDFSYIDIEPGRGCRYIPPDEYSRREVRCRGSVQAVRVYLGDSDDRVSLYHLGSARRLVDGGRGSDSIDMFDSVGMSGPLHLKGGAGDDLLIGGSERTRLEGGAGDDVLLGGGGADNIFGGPDTDTVSYDEPSSVFGPPQVVFVKLDGKGPDGARGERDRIAADVENVTGGGVGDELIGSGGPNTVGGGPGDDDIVGRGGRDVLSGGPGDDRMRSRDGRRDVVGCGGGDADRAFVDQFDDVGVECELIRVRGTRPPRR